MKGRVITVNWKPEAAKPWIRIRRQKLFIKGNPKPQLLQTSRPNPMRMQLLSPRRKKNAMKLKLQTNGMPVGLSQRKGRVFARSLQKAQIHSEFRISEDQKFEKFRKLSRYHSCSSSSSSWSCYDLQRATMTYIHGRSQQMETQLTSEADVETILLRNSAKSSMQDWKISRGKI